MFNDAHRISSPGGRFDSGCAVERGARAGSGIGICTMPVIGNRAIPRPGTELPRF
jgi:hypothetical protein